MKQNPTFFLIDDDTDDQEIFSIALEKANNQARCIFANDGIHALNKIHEDESIVPDFIFIDMNMPRMNGHQCLLEIKKIERLKDIPIYMYSTSVDPGSIAEYKKQGAADFIVKPFDINMLASLLSSILKNRILLLLILLVCNTLSPTTVLAQEDSIASVSKLKKMSVEQLLSVEVTSVSKSPQKLKETASAIQVILGSDIKRSGATRLPEALRLATNLQVAQSGSHDWGITARGFNGVPVSNSSLANKLLVLIDGRTVYTPLFGGVFWDVQNVLLEDIDQLEVISGPGGALWGGNAVNGIINIKSKSAKETQGIYAAGAAGTFLQDFAAFRIGSHVDSTLYFRVYGQRFDYNATRATKPTQPDDSWYMNQGGFRMDYYPKGKSSFTLQGDLYGGKEDDTASTLVNGQNILARWNLMLSDNSGLELQVYYDRTFRNIQRQELSDELNTYDLDFNHNFLIGKKHRFIWGMGYRISDDNLTFVNDEFKPEDRRLHLWSSFIQDQIYLFNDKVELTLGTKLLHNDYTGFEFHPSGRLAWNIHSKHVIWGAVSQGVRVPTRFDADNNGTSLGSYGEYKSEKVISYEAGYRVQPFNNLSLSVATYYSQYRDLRSIDTNQVPTPQFYFANNMEAESHGIELSANYIATSWWKLRGGYTYMNKKFIKNSPFTYPESDVFEAIDPRNHFLIQSMVDITRSFQLDIVARYVDVLPEAITIPFVSSYITCDIRLAWNYKWATISVIGQNLVQSYHKEFGERKIPRSIYGKLSLIF